jgi:hypothetical protein
MGQLDMLVPALGAASQRHHSLWWIILAVVIFALLSPLAYILGTHGGRSEDQGPLHRSTHH